MPPKATKKPMTMAGQERPGTSCGFFRARRMVVICCIYQNRRFLVFNLGEVRSKRREYAGRTEPMPTWGAGGEIAIYTSSRAPHREGPGQLSKRSGGRDRGGVSRANGGCACIEWGAQRVSAGTCLRTNRVARSRQDTHHHDAGLGVGLVELLLVEPWRITEVTSVIE